MDKRWNKDIVGYGPQRFAIKSCGKRHGFCKICRPDIAQNIKAAARRGKGADDTAYLAPGYKPHPTKTMWERHAERNGIDPNLHPHPYLHVGSLKTHKEQKEEIKQVVEESKIKEGDQYSDYELSRLFGFDRRTIIAFRENERMEKKERIREEKRKARDEKRKHIAPREKLILELRLDKMMTLDAIAAQCDPPITRERVRQILQNIERKAGIKIPAYPSRDAAPKPLIVAVHCKVCGKILELPENKVEKWRSNFCKEHAMSQLQYSYWQREPRWLDMDENARTRWIYHNDPNRKAQMASSNKMYRLKRDADPARKEAYKVKFGAYHKEYWKKKNAENKAKLIRPFIETDGD